MYSIKWTNTLSGETGYIESVDYDGKFFKTTNKLSEAQMYGTQAMIDKILRKLEKYGQGSEIHNKFEVVEAV